MSEFYHSLSRTRLGPISLVAIHPIPPVVQGLTVDPQLEHLRGIHQRVERVDRAVAPARTHHA